MPMYQWVGVSPRGETLKGQMEATTRQAVITRLRHWLCGAQTP